MLLSRRMFWTRALVASLAPTLALVHGHWLAISFEQHELLHESLSLALVLMGAFGRIWASLYVAGRKNTALVQEGPYSLCRHPLYFFSLIGFAGLLIAANSVIATLAAGALFLALYPGTISREEKHLARLFGEEFRRYRETTPLLIPKPSLYRSGETISIFPRSVVKAIFENAWWIVAWQLVNTIEDMHLLRIITPLVELRGAWL